ncbi:MAG: hypothetical protein WBC22_08775 [Sedimentisphaerales bacterium]
MSSALDWLPPVVSVDGEFAKVVSELYNFFHQGFIENKPKLDSMDVWHDRKVKLGETYEEVFWHLIEREWEYNNPGERTLDPRRAERLPWCSPVINHFEDKATKYWICHEKGKYFCYVWLEEYDYIVILQKRTLKAKVINGIELKERQVAFLMTAYYVDGESKRRSFRRKYERRIT